MEFLIFVLGCLAISIFLTCYYRHRKRIEYFTREGIPHVKPTFMFGNSGPVRNTILSLIQQNEMVYKSHLTAKYVGYYQLSNPIIIIRDLDLIKSITVKNFEYFTNHGKSLDDSVDNLFNKSLLFLRDDAWKNSRSVLIHAFTSNKIKKYFEFLSNSANEFSNHIYEISKNYPAELEMKSTFARYTTDAVAKICFGVNANSMRDETDRLYLMNTNIAKFKMMNSVKIFLFRAFPSLTKFFGMRMFNKEVVDYFRQMINNSIRKRELNNNEYNDMIQIMLEAQKDGNPYFKSCSEIHSHAFLFFFASSNVTATAIAFITYELAKNREIQDKLYAEIKASYEQCNGEVTPEILRNMKYLDAVFNESLRKYPPDVQLDRVCSKTFQLPPALPNSSPYTVQPNTLFIIPLYSIHHDPLHFPQPESFNPQRFLDLKEAPRGFMPFGMGPRHCIAEKFSTMMIKLMLFHLLRQCELIPSPRTPEIILRTTLFVIESKNSLWIRIIPRE